MRILHVLPNLTGGGAETQAALLTRGLADRGHDVAIAYLHNGNGRLPWPIDGVRLYQVQCAGNYDPLILPRLVRLFRQFDAEVVQTWILQMDVLAGAAARLTGIPWIVRESSSALRYHGSWKHRLREQLVSWSAAHVVSNSNGGVMYWSHISAAKRSLIRNGVLRRDSVFESTLSRPLDLFVHDAHKLVVFAGRLEAEKNLPTLIDAFAQVVSRGHVLEARLVICGVGSLHDSLAQQIERQNLMDKVLLVGHLPTDLLWVLLKRADLFTFVSSFEGMPNAVAEAMVCGCPLLVSEIPAHREFLDECSARFVPHNDTHAIADAIEECFVDEMSVRHRAEAAAGIAAAWSVDAMAKSYETLYQQVVRDQSRAP